MSVYKLLKLLFLVELTSSKIGATEIQEVSNMWLLLSKHI